MKLQLFVLGIVFLFSINTIGQVISNVDFNEVERITKNERSDFFYPDLMKRYVDNDTALSSFDYFFLYYGYIYSKDYNPYSVSKKKEKLIKYIKERNYKKIIKTGEKMLKKDPLNLEVLFSMFMSYMETKQKSKADIYAHKYYKIIRTILDSGDGKAEESAFVVTKVRDEYEVLSVLNLESTGQALVGNCDKLKLKTPNEYGLEQLYFNVEKPLEYLSKSLE